MTDIEAIVAGVFVFFLAILSGISLVPLLHWWSSGENPADTPGLRDGRSLNDDAADATSPWYWVALVAFIMALLVIL